MQDHKSIICAAGSDDFIASSLSTSVHTVRSWKQRNSIPSEHWLWFAGTGCASLEQIAAIAADRKRAAA